MSDKEKIIELIEQRKEEHFRAKGELLMGKEKASNDRSIHDHSIIIEELENILLMIKSGLLD